MTRVGSLRHHGKGQYSLDILSLRSSGVGQTKTEHSNVPNVMLNISPRVYILVFQTAQWGLLLPVTSEEIKVQQIVPRCNCLMSGGARVQTKTLCPEQNEAIWLFTPRLYWHIWVVSSKSEFTWVPELYFFMDMEIFWAIKTSWVGVWLPLGGYGLVLSKGSGVLNHPVPTQQTFLSQNDTVMNREIVMA